MQNFLKSSTRTKSQNSVHALRRSISRSSLEKPSPNVPPNSFRLPIYHETLSAILTHESVSKMWAECRQYSIREQCRGALLQKRPSKSDVRYKDYCDEREQGLRSFQEDDPLAVPSTSHCAPRSRLFQLPFSWCKMETEIETDR